MNNTSQKIMNALEFEKMAPEIKGRRAEYTNMLVGNIRANGTVVLPTNSGSETLGSVGQIQIQTYAGSAVLAVNLGGTTFYFASAGTLA